MIALVVTVAEEGVPEAEQYAFIKSPVRIGRGELNELPLPQPFVSTYHGLVQFDDREAHYVDLGSLNKSVLDGEVLEPNEPALLDAGAEVRIGSFSLTFSRKPVSEHPPTPARQMTAFALRAASCANIPPPESLHVVGQRGELAHGDLPPQPRVPEPGRATAPDPAQPGPPAAPDPQAEKAAGAAIEAAALELDLSYASYRGTWEHLRAAIEAAVAPLDGTARQLALETMAARYPGLSAEPQFMALLPPARAAPAGLAPTVEARATPLAVRAPSVTGSGDGALRLLRAFCESYLPVTPDHLGASDIEAVLGRTASALEAFARAFVELRRGHEEFGKDMGLRTVQGDGAIQRADDAHQLLSYVLDPRGSGRDRELQRAFADFMIHQVALLRGVVEGAQALLVRLDPDAISKRAPQSLWTLRAQALWRSYEDLYHELAGDEGAVSEILFGKEFARAYLAMAGQRERTDRRGSGEAGGGERTSEPKANRRGAVERLPPPRHEEDGEEP